MGDDWGSFQSFKILSQAIVFTFFYFLPASTLQARVFQIPPCFSCLLIFSRAILSAWNDPFHLGSSNLLSSFPGSSAGKESACNAGDPSLISGSGRSPGGGPGHTLVFLLRESPWTEEPGRLQSMGSQRVRRDWTTKHITAREYVQESGQRGGLGGLPTLGSVSAVGTLSVLLLVLLKVHVP